MLAPLPSQSPAPGATMRRSPASSFVLGTFVLAAVLLPQRAGAQINGIGPTGPVVRAFQGFSFTEGPAQNAAGDLYFTDVNTNTIHRVDTANVLSTFLNGSQAANGLDFDRNDRSPASW